MATRIEFQGSQGDVLAARLDEPALVPRAFALFAHCFTCSKDIAAASRISRALAGQGIAVLRFDFTGLGHSDGEFANTNFSSNVEDLVAAANWLREEHEAPSLLVGHSLGGAAVLAAAERLPEVKAVATVGAPADPSHVERLIRSGVVEEAGEGDVVTELAGRRFSIRREFFEDLKSQALPNRIGSLKKALLVLHSPGDLVVGIDNASQIFQAARHPKSFVSLDGADHLLTDRQDAAYVADVIAAWATRYLPAAAVEETPDVEPGEVLVTENGAFTYSQDVQVGPHRILADEPPSVGGADTGPTPYGLLLAAIGACTSMTRRMYAKRKEIPVEKISVRLKHQKIHARDCEECETQEGFIDQIESEIDVSGDLQEAQRQRLLEIAGRCPVHRTLHSEVSITSRLRS